MSTQKVGRKTVKIEFDIIDVDIIRAKTPVDTGRLRDDFAVDINGDIINEVEYAGWVELGTTKMPGSFMVTQSLGEIGERLAKKIAEQINQPGLIILPEIKIKIGK